MGTDSWLRMSPESAESSMKKKVDAVCLSPKAKAHTKGCLPRLRGKAAGWKPTTPNGGMDKISALSREDQPKQKMTSGLFSFIHARDSCVLISFADNTGMSYF